MNNVINYEAYCHVDGVEYHAQTVERGECAGCAGDYGGDLCTRLGDCTIFRTDHTSVIWVRAE